MVGDGPARNPASILIQENIPDLDIRLIWVGLNQSRNDIRLVLTQIGQRKYSVRGANYLLRMMREIVD